MTSQKIAVGLAVALFAGVVTAHAADYSVGYKAYQSGDYATALRIMREHADKGNADAQTYLGFMYHNGLGVRQDYAAALRWFRKAADQGNAKAQTNLAFMYRKGQGVRKDYVQAHMWYNLAAARGLKIGRKNRDLLAEKMTPAQIVEARRLAREWKPKGKWGLP